MTPPYLTARAMTVREALSSRVFRVPGYQRPYAWPPEVAVQLLEDVTDAMGRADRGVRDYFLGSIVVAGDGPVDVVDGQQRLITLTILLAILRDRLGASGASATPVIWSDRGPRVQPRLKDAAFFEQYVQRPGSTAAPVPSSDLPAAGEEEDEEDDGAEDEEEDDEDDTEEDEEEEEPSEEALVAAHDSRRAMVGARDAVAGRVDALSTEGRAGLLDFVLDHCHVIVVAAPAGPDAHRVFTVMHTRGVDLTKTDVLKSEVLGSERDLVEQARLQAVWEEVEDDLGRDRFQSLFGHWRWLASGKPPTGETFEDLRRLKQPAAAPRAFVAEMREHGKRLEWILDGTFGGTVPDDVAARVNRRLLRLGLLPYSGWIPVAMALLERFGATATNIDWLVTRLDRFAYGLAFAAQSHEREKRLAAALQVIQSKGTAERVTQALALTPKEETTFAAVFCGRKVMVKLAKRVLLLRRLDSEQLDGPLPDYAGTNVEHVLPLNPGQNSQWRKLYGSGGLPTEALGNLLVLPKAVNSRLGNHEFADKQAVLRQAVQQTPRRMALGLVPGILAASGWGPDDLEARTDGAIRRLLEVWDLRRPSEVAMAEAPPPPAPKKKKKRKKSRRNRRKGGKAAVRT